MMRTQHLEKEYTKKILDDQDKIDAAKEAIELASEIKITATAFENLSKNLLPIAIVVARPKGSNETLLLISDACEVARLIAKDLN